MLLGKIRIPETLTATMVTETRVNLAGTESTENRKMRFGKLA